MSYGFDQTQANRLRIWLIVVSVLMVIGLTVGIFVSIRWNKFKKEQEALAISQPETGSGGAVMDSTRTPVPTMTMTNLPTITMTPTPTATGTPAPAMSATPAVDKSVFPYTVKDILYLAESYDQDRYWKPGDAVAQDVAENDYDAIMELLHASHVQREQAFLTETFPDYALLNDGFAIEQLKNYYTTSIDKTDTCTLKINIVDGQFQTFIISYDGTNARVMTVKIETRIETCDGVITSRSVYNDYYAYENLVRKFYMDNDQSAWKIIEHTASMGVK